MNHHMTEWDAARYAHISGLQKAMAEEALALLELNGSEDVLDVGCGDGKVTALITARLPRGAVTGVDPSHDMIAFAAEHFSADRYPNLRFEQADAHALPFESRFDLVVSFNALHWIPDQGAALRSIRAAMKPGARAQLRLVTAGPRKSLESVVEDVRRSPRWDAHFSGFSDPYLRLTPKQYAALAEQTGLHTSRIHTALKTWNFETRAAFFGFCSVGLVAWTRRLPETDRPAFVNEVLDRYRALPGGGQTVFNFYQTDITLTVQGKP